MSERFQYYNSGDDHTANIGLVNWEGQTFTVLEAHIITSVKLKLFRVGSPGTITVSIRATSGGLPTGPDLCSGTTDGNTLATGAPYEWREITFGAGASLDADTQYAICIRALSAVLWTDYVNIRSDSTSPSYTGGSRCSNDNNGADADWFFPAEGNESDDNLFEEWGDALEASTVTQQKPSNIQATVATGHGNITDLGSPNPTQHGHCWNSVGAPTTSDSKTTNGVVSATGAFTSSMTSLVSGRKYYVRAYATNAAGTSYSSTIWSFIAGGGGQHIGLGGSVS